MTRTGQVIAFASSVHSVRSPYSIIASAASQPATPSRWWARSASGVRRTVCWHLAPEIAHYEDPFTMMELLQGKLLLLTHDDDGRLTRREPAADSFRLLAEHLDGAQSVVRVPLEQHPDVCAFMVRRRNRRSVLVLWKDGEVFSGEDDLPTVVEWPWPHGDVVAIDALGTEQLLGRRDGRVRVPVSVTPLLVAPGGRPAGSRL